MSRIFYGWWMVTAGAVVHLLSGALLFHAFSAYVLPVQAEFGWSRTQVSLAYALQRVESGFLGPLQGWMVDRYGPRRMMLLGMIFFAAGFVLLSQVQSLAGFYIAALVLALGSSLGGWMPIASAVTHWFRRRRATALGLVMSGMGVGGFLVPGVVWVIQTHGWRTMALLSAGLLLAVGLPMAQLMRRPPEHYGQAPDGVARSPAGQDARPRRQANVPGRPEPEFTAREAMRTRAFWVMTIVHGTAVLTVGAVLLHQIPHMVQGVGLSETTAASMVAVLLAFTIMGQLFGGYFADRVDKRYPIFAGLWMHAGGMLVFAYASSVAGTVAFAALHGIAWGMRGTAINALRADYFGRVSFATIMGYGSLFMMFGMTVGPMFAGMVFDHTGSYRIAFLTLAVSSAAASILVFFLHPPAKPDHPPAKPDHPPAKPDHPPAADISAPVPQR